ncbi:FIST signal transduction protein [Parachryseolinea silvisoli]|uniref:FIST signal transduction protein n=1 Tax=Parachryseolinea silvisoli TaxID=2873601 RepID=UPI002265E1CA|nr:FIST N-terminal domain-containing protein [Parachryseolinea silvisoli]MCD9014813.1 FIST C-terminal domain-containing protein [Parachryseolinea silvisoli]
MKIKQYQYIGGQWKNNFTTAGFHAQQAQLILVFGEPGLITQPALFDEIRDFFPKGNIVSCSTAGEIMGEDVYDNSIAVTAIQFEKTVIKCCATHIQQHDNSYETGKYLMQELLADNLNTVLVISDGTYVNGSELVSGLNENNPENIPVTGGLAADGDRFIRTFVGLDQVPEEGTVIAVGFYGSNLHIGHGYFGGWDEFGPHKKITRAEKNVLYEIDGKNALDLYKEYLGPYQDELPGSALLFPLSMQEEGSNEPVVRTILSINEEDKSMVFAGNLPQGSTVRLMKANFDKLIDGSSLAAQSALTNLAGSNSELALFISCVGRKLILQARTNEEVAAAKGIFGENTPVTGFYSYGEISPFAPLTRCELHNQTMTITTFSES